MNSVIEQKDGSKLTYDVNGVLVKVDKADGTQIWYTGGLIGRNKDEGPAIIRPDGTEIYWEDDLSQQI